MKELAATLKTQYENATTYQRNQLTVAEKKQYEAIQTLYGTDGSTLPAAGTATLKFTYQLPEGVDADALNFKTFTAANSSLNSFSDHASVSGYAVMPLQWAVAEKLVNGSNGKLMPTGNASRAQVAAILHRFAENVAKTTK